MDKRLIPFVSPNASFNVTLKDVEHLEKQLRKMNIAVISVVASPIPGTTPTADVAGLKDMGMQPDDALNYMFQVSGSLSASQGGYQQASEVMEDLAPLNQQAVSKVCADLFGSSGQDSRIAAYNSLCALDGIDALIKENLSNV